MLHHIAAAVGRDITPTVLGEASHEIPAQYLDSTAAREELGWAPLVGLDEGLRRTADWYRKHLASA
jgi:nucleoside-diphosphate-sugar epimerase